MLMVYSYCVFVLDFEFISFEIYFIMEFDGLYIVLIIIVLGYLRNRVSFEFG